MGNQVESKGCLSGCLGKMIFAALILIVGISLLAFLSLGTSSRVIVPGGASPAGQVAPGIMPEAAAFLAVHPEFGKAVSSTDAPNWAAGKRQNIKNNKGETLLFYEKGGKIVTVYRNDPPKPREMLWGDTEN